MDFIVQLFMKALTYFSLYICSDEKYQQFQADQNLHYTCAACRGDCYQVLYAFQKLFV